MSHERWARMQAAYLAAEALPVAERASFLDEACSGDAALRAEIEALLNGAPDTRSVLERGEPGVTAAGVDRPLLIGTRLGPWSIERLIGRGGMGEVYEAKRADGAFELRVAVKLLKRGLDSEAVVARFAKERRILAQLDHPNIARVLDAGVAADGRPFLAMEFVEGQPITEYCRAQGLNTTAILRLMITVGEAVQAAHAKRIVHRDLKPSNVLVTLQGQVKLLDFGIAKALAEEDADATRMAGDAMALTPAYAAPEQLLGTAASPASDVYALGVILYQLLAERLPHTRSGRSITDIVLGLERETAERPSTVLRKERGRLPEQQRIERLRAVSRDLDLIVLKALQAQAGRRYPNGQAFADDLQRLLDHRPILARPDSVAYRARRFIRRNRLPVAATAAVLLALTAGLAAALWQAHVAVLARNDATHRREQADDLVNFMLGDLKSHLAQVGRLDILDSTVAKAADYLGHAQLSTMQDTALRQRISVLSSIAEIRNDRGDFTGSIASSKEAVQAARLLQQHSPGPASDELLADALLALLSSTMDGGDFATAGRIDAEGLPLARRLPLNDSHAAHRLTLVSGFEFGLADILTDGPAPDLAKAQSLYDECASMLEPWTSKPDSVPELVVEQLRCEAARAVALSRLGRSEDAHAILRQLVNRSQAFQQRYPGNVPVLKMLEYGLATAAHGFSSSDYADEAELAAQRGEEIGRALMDLEPNDEIIQLEYADVLDSRANLSQRKGQWSEAKKDCDRALSVLAGKISGANADDSARELALNVYLTRAQIDGFGLHNRRDALQGLNEALSHFQPADTQVDRLAEMMLSMQLLRWQLAIGTRQDLAQAARTAALELIRLLKARLGSQRLLWAEVMQDYIEGNRKLAEQAYADLQKSKDRRLEDVNWVRSASCRGCRSGK